MRYLTPDDVLVQAAELATEGTRVSPLGAEDPAREMVVLELGRGPAHLAVKGNAHADEPSGTVTCLELARWLLGSAEGAAWLDRCSFHLLPTANPQGLRRNAAWLGDGSPDLLTWFQHVRRDPPTEDREFGYGETADQAAHPENAAWHRYLDRLPRLDGYLSLHSMAFAGGAWFLVMLDDLERRRGLLERLERVAGEIGLPLHDEDRGGRKGFWRIGPGFSTAPTREEMSSFFSGADLPGAPDWLRLNSMQVVRRRHGTPLALVSELPQWWDPALSDMSPIARSRGEVDRDMARRVAGTLAELERLAQELPGSAEIEHELAHRGAAVRATEKLAGQWGTRAAARRDEAAAELAELRASAANAALAARACDSADRDSAAWLAELALRVARLEARFSFRALPLEDQVKAQMEMARVVAQEVVGA